MKLAVSRKPCLATIKHYAKPFVQHKVCHGLLLYLHNALVCSYVECSEKLIIVFPWVEQKQLITSALLISAAYIFQCRDKIVQYLSRNHDAIPV